MKLFQRNHDFHKTSRAILHNSFVLYFIFFIAIANLFVFASSSKLLACAVFVLVGILTSFFSKNMIVIMLISIVVANLFQYGTQLRSEGFKNEEEEKEEFGDKEEDKEEFGDKEEDEEK